MDALDWSREHLEADGGDLLAEKIKSFGHCA
jgi:hypothetical protein